MTMQSKFLFFPPTLLVILLTCYRAINYSGVNKNANILITFSLNIHFYFIVSFEQKVGHMLHSEVVMHRVVWLHSMWLALIQKNMMTWVTWIPWKWNRFANGKCNSKVCILICSGSCHINIWTEIMDFCYLNAEKYEYVGRLLRPGEEPNSYSDEEEESSESVKANKSEDITNINSTDASNTASDKPKEEWLIWSESSDANNSPNNRTKSFTSVTESSNSSNILNNYEIIGANGTNDQRLTK